MTIEERSEKAVELKRNGYNCAQAVAAALCDQTDFTKEDLIQAAAGFGGGMGTMEATCGALIGAGIVAGLSTHGNGTMKLTRQLITDFKSMCGAVTCRDLKSRIDGKVLCPCDDCVRNAVLAYGKAADIG